MTNEEIARAEVRAPTINIDSVSKWFGNVVAVNDVSLQVQPGITGLLGPNGAGKTTLLRMISGLAKPSEGSIELLGQPVRGNPELYRRIGVMTEQEAVYESFTGREFVTFSAKMYGLDPVEPAVDKAIERAGLMEASNRPLGTYSRGMRQRMRLAATLAASGAFRAIRAKLDERPYRVRVDTADPRSMAAALIGSEAVDSVTIDSERTLIVLSSNVTALQRSIPRIAKERNIRLLRVEPLDESLESVFGYLVDA